MKKLNKKGYSLQDLVPLAIAFVVITIVISVGADILSSIQDDQTGNSTAWNATGNGLDSLDELSSWLPTIALVVAAAVIIGVVLVYFRFRG